ncbi:MAG: GGDEF domain-containing protein [Planctomycetota bacterium]|nr:GGDEF domain-containing protein [Planctomycetota bacterium]MDA1211363.1 GGDEF domain-containing protein [Planctomycetota bacterium]
MTEPDLHVMDELFQRPALLSAYRWFRMLRLRSPKFLWLIAVVIPAMVTIVLERFVPLPVSWLVLLTPSVLFIGIIFSIAQACFLCLLIPILYLLIKEWYDPSAAAVAWQVAIWSLFHFGTCTALLAGWKTTTRRAAKIAERDALTGAGNSTSFFRIAKDAIKRCLAAGRPLSIAVMDCDGFKQFNDAHGHLAGDRFLQQLAQALQERLSPDDRLIRWGGDEFVILFPYCGADRSRPIVDFLRVGITTELKPFAGPVTFSWGLVSYDLPHGNAESLLKDADQLMYDAKRAGGNQICFRHVVGPKASPPPGEPT